MKKTILALALIACGTAHAQSSVTIYGILDLGVLPWLDRIGATLASSDGDVIVTCSALKRRYRDRLRSRVGELRFVHVEIDRALAEQRVKSRPGHFFPDSLVTSQIEALEPTTHESDVVSVCASSDSATQVRAVLDWLGLASR